MIPRPAALAGVLGLVLGALPVGAQTPMGRPPIVDLSLDTVRLGEAFELDVTLTVPPGYTVYFPDTLAATERLESLDPVRWSAEEAPGEGARLTLTYPVIAFDEGFVPVPGLDVLLAPSASGGSREPLAGGSGVGDWSEAPDADLPGLARWRIARRAVWVTPVFTEADLVEGIEPRPPRDVAGASWHWPSLALALVFSGLLIGIVASGARARWAPGASGSASSPLTVGEVREEALRELEQLATSGLAAAGRSHELYTRSSGVVRRYVERLDDAWGPGLTSGELMACLEGSPHAGSAGDLLLQMREAEAVKFGLRRPGESESVEHCRALHAWVDGSGSATP